MAWILIPAYLLFASVTTGKCPASFVKIVEKHWSSQSQTKKFRCLAGRKNWPGLGKGFCKELLKKKPTTVQPSGGGGGGGGGGGEPVYCAKEGKKCPHCKKKVEYGTRFRAKCNGLCTGSGRSLRRWTCRGS